MSCASNDDCTLFRIEPGHCCDFGELRGINRRFQAEAEKEWGPTPEELEAARKAELICTDSCMAPPDSAAVCKQGRCAVVYVDASP